MRRIGKFVLVAVTVLAVLLVAAISLTIGWRPFIGPKARALTNRRFESTPERIQRGQYLANAVMGCFYCHSEHDWKAEGAPIIQSKMGAGGRFEGDFPGIVYTPNITPDKDTGAGSWSDDQLARAIREGIGHDGRTLFPLMPYDRFRQMSDDDLASVVVYLRTLPPVRNSLPPTEIIFPVKYLIRSAPQPVEAPVPAPDLSDPVTRGEYLVRLASCEECHTPQEKGQPRPGMAFAGGNVFTGPFGTVASANITPDASGISYYDESLFLTVMRTGKVKARVLNPLMPWSVYRNMTDNDLKSVFAYLRTLKPIQHRVDNTERMTACRRCSAKHGGGQEN